MLKKAVARLRVAKNRNGVPMGDQRSPKKLTYFHIDAFENSIEHHKFTPPIELHSTEQTNHNSGQSDDGSIDGAEFMVTEGPEGGEVKIPTPKFTKKEIGLTLPPIPENNNSRVAAP
jgi:hypothetical protein